MDYDPLQVSLEINKHNCKYAILCKIEVFFVFLQKDKNKILIYKS